MCVCVWGGGGGEGRVKVGTAKCTNGSYNPLLQKVMLYPWHHSPYFCDQVSLH